MIGCATCGAAPVGSFGDGSPRFPRTCDHPPIRGDDMTTSIDQWGRVIVELDPFEIIEAQSCGKLRLDRATKRNAKDHFGDPSLTSHVLGALGERVFTKWAGVPWGCTTGRYGGLPDVAGCQIRAVSDAKKLCKVRPNDPGRTPVVSIVANGTARYWIRGWIMARDAKKYPLTDPGNRGADAHFVPSADLRPMSEFLAFDPVRAAMGLPPMGA